MYHKGHYAKLRRPTGPELFEDASRILDELLQKQLNDDLKSHGRPPRFKTHPLSSRRPVTSGELLDERDEAGLDDGIERCKTMPSRMRESTTKEEPLLPKDLELDTLRKKPDKHNRLKGDASASSADTEGDSASASEKRKKKDVLRRVKDRILHSFHRQERAKEIRLKDGDSPKVSPKKQAKKTTKKPTDADQNGVKDKGSKHDGAGDSKEAAQSSQFEGYGKRRNSAGKLLNSIRKSFRSKKDERRARSSSIQDETKRPSVASSSGTSKPSLDEELPPQHQHPSAPHPPVSPPPSARYPPAPSAPHPQVPPPPSARYPPAPPPPSARHPQVPPPPPPGSAPRPSAPPHRTGPSGDARVPPPPPPPPPSGSSLTVPAAPGRKDSSHSAHEKSASPYPYSSSTESYLDSGGISSSMHSFSSKQTNVLDDPGYDIQYMDGVGGEEGRRGGGTVLNGHSEALRGYGRRNEEEYNGRTRRPYMQQSSLCIDGDTDTQDGKGRPLTKTDDIPIHERTAEEKDEMYGKIAQKLIHIADTFAAESGQSESEGHHKEGGAAAARLGPEGDGVLSDLEKQIMDCLRDAGDRNADIIDSQAEGVIQQTKAQTYERFKATVQQSLGNDVSWNHVAFLFYTTKGVMSAVGLGSKMAGDAKEMTLRYFSDKFAKWLMDQGGFDSVLSDSDSELD